MARTRTDITTLDQLKRTIRSPACKGVFAQVRFGCSEQWVKLAKVEALAFVDDLGGGTPRELEMYSGSFGEFDGRSLWMG